MLCITLDILLCPGIHTTPSDVRGRFSRTPRKVAAPQPARPSPVAAGFCRHVVTNRPRRSVLHWLLWRMKRASHDTLTARQRSERMSRVRSKDTKPEIRVRRLIHGMGYRYRLHAKDLPGCPDLVFRSRRKVVFVHGCFWHRHDGCSRNRIPKSPERQAFWRSKLDENARRDQVNQTALEELGWRVLVVWECETKDVSRLANRVRTFLGLPRSDR